MYIAFSIDHSAAGWPGRRVESADLESRHPEEVCNMFSGPAAVDALDIELLLTAHEMTISSNSECVTQ